ncbi:MAG: YheU family protein [Gammaproteobacteria bacterium]|jgi:uncharacterized protein YheU (UPF0270 family)|nr:YheU family protein [Gammaproteobacteria bacterium]
MNTASGEDDAPSQWPSDAAAEPPLQIPHEALSPDALRGLLEAFVLREGTEYGAQDVPLETKVQQVLRQLERGEAQVIFDPQTESTDIVTTRALRAGR